MNRISCEVHNCSHNESNTCYANVVNIGGHSAKKDCDTCCGSFLDKKNYGTLTNNTNGNCECTSLVCNVESCKYNSNTSCTLDNIDVTGSDVHIYIETNCSSFCNKL